MTLVGRLFHACATVTRHDRSPMVLSHVCVYASLCTIVIHNTAQNSYDQWPNNRPCRPCNAGGGGPQGAGALVLYVMRKHTRRLGCISSLLVVLFMFLLAPATTCQFRDIALPEHAEGMSGISVQRVRAEPSGPFCVAATNVVSR